MDFAYLIKILLRRKWIIISCVIAAVVAAFILTKNQKREFKSTAQLSTGFTVSEEIRLSDEKFNPAQIDVKFNNAIENITSPKVLSLVSYRLTLHDLTEPDPFTRVDVEKKALPAFRQLNKAEAVSILRRGVDSLKMLSPADPAQKKVLDYIDLIGYDVSTISKSLHVARYQRTDYINIIYLSQNANLSAFAANSTCNEFKRFYGIDKRERTVESIALLDSLVNIKKATLDEKVQAKNDYMSARGILDVGMEGSSKLGQISSYESQLIDEQAMQQNLTYRIQELEKTISNAQSKGISSVTVPVNTSKANNDYLQLKKQYNEINSQYIRNGGNNPDLKRQRDELAQKMSSLNFNDNSLITDKGESVISIEELQQRKIDAEALLRQTNQKVNAYKQKIGQLNGGISGMATKGAAIEQYDKQIEIASAEYREAKDKLNLALNFNDVAEGGFKQTLIAEPALGPEASKRIMIVALSGVCAFFLSTFSILGFAFFDQSIKTPAYFQKLTGLPLLGAVNWVKMNNSNLKDRVTFFDGTEKRDNTFRELIRKLRYEIESSGKQIFLFTSTEPQQGKTSLIQALAYGLSLSKRKVLIIDTNFCNNDLTVATHADPVLETFYVNGKPFELNDIRRLITHTAVEGVDIIGCHGGDYTPSEILPQNHLLNYLGQLKTSYDFIFLEGAPLNFFTDTKELIQYADGLIAVFSAENSLTAADKESMEFFREHKEKFIGAVLNKVQHNNLDM